MTTQERTAIIELARIIVCDSADAIRDFGLTGLSANTANQEVRSNLRRILVPIGIAERDYL